MILTWGHVVQVLEKEAFQKQMLEKLIWIAAFMLVGARHPGATVGVVEKEFRSEVRLVLQSIDLNGMQRGIFIEILPQLG